MSSQEITLKTILDVMNSKFEQIDKKFEQIDKRFEQIDKRFEQIDKRFEQIDKRFEQIDKKFEQIDKKFEQIDERLNLIDTRITKLIADNREEHDQLLHEQKITNNIVLKVEAEHEDKIKILFDAVQSHKDHQTLFGNQLRRLSQQVDIDSYRISNLEKSLKHA